MFPRMFRVISTGSRLSLQMSFFADFIQDCIGEQRTTGSKDGPEGSHRAAWDGWLLGPQQAGCSLCSHAGTVQSAVGSLWHDATAVIFGDGQCTDLDTWPHRSERFGPEESPRLQQFQFFHAQTHRQPPEPLAEKEMHLVFSLPLFLEVVFHSLPPSS